MHVRSPSRVLASTEFIFGYQHFSVWRFLGMVAITTLIPDEWCGGSFNCVVSSLNIIAEQNRQIALDGSLMHES
jgi:hypothetical protein